MLVHLTPGGRILSVGVGLILLVNNAVSSRRSCTRKNSPFLDKKGENKEAKNNLVKEAN